MGAGEPKKADRVRRAAEAWMKGHLENVAAYREAAMKSGLPSETGIHIIVGDGPGHFVNFFPLTPRLKLADQRFDPPPGCFPLIVQVGRKGDGMHYNVRMDGGKAWGGIEADRPA
jgi:hypothetical protein